MTATTAETMKVKDYLPPFIAEARNIESIELKRRGYDDTVEVKITFVAKTDRAKREFDAIEGIGQRPDFPRQSSPSDCTHCDGPCGRRIPSQEIIQFGDCDHNICQTCLKSSSSSTVGKVQDGWGGCRNETCRARRASCKKSNRATSSTASGSSSKKKSKTSRQKKAEGRKERLVDKSDKGEVIKKAEASRPPLQASDESSSLVTVNVVVFALEKTKILRRSVELELLDETKMSYVVEKARLLMEGQGLDTSQWYYTPKDRFSRKDLLRFKPDEVAEKTIGQMTDYEEVLSVMVATPGTTI